MSRGLRADGRAGRRSTRVALMCALMCALGFAGAAGCQALVGIPGVSLEADDGGVDGTVRDGGVEMDSGVLNGPCDLAADGAARMGPAMVLIDASTFGSYCIDTTEVTVSQFNTYHLDTAGLLTDLPPECDGVLALPDVDNTVADQNLPMGDLGVCHAYSYCRWAGKRLCGALGDGGSVLALAPDQTEWGYACVNGIYNYVYFFNSSYEAGVCNIDSDGAVPVTSMTGCHGVMPPFDQIYDMVGNDWEFVNDLGNNGQSVSAHGGSYTTMENELPGEDNGGACGYQVGFNGVIYDNQQSGFRCCADPAP